MTEQPVYYTPEQVVEIFGDAFTVNYVKENARHWPHIRIARQFRFTPEHVEQIAALHEQHPTEAIPNRNTFGRRGRRSA